MERKTEFPIALGKAYYLNELDPDVGFSEQRVFLPQIMMDKSMLCRAYRITVEQFDAVMATRPVGPHAPGSVDCSWNESGTLPVAYDAVAFGIALDSLADHAQPEASGDASTN